MKIATRAYLSIQHVQGLSYLHREAHRLRDVLAADRNDANRSAYRAICASAIFTSGAFLEALINEIYAEIVDGGPHIDVGRTSEMVRALWRRDIPRTARFATLEKYQILLDILGKPAFEAGASHYQDADAVVRLRNALIHYEPESVVIMSADPNELTIQKMQKQLSGKFPQDDFENGFFSFFPDRCLCAGSVAWAKRSVIDFADEFFRRIDHAPIYNHVRDDGKKPNPLQGTPAKASSIEPDGRRS